MSVELEDTNFVPYRHQWSSNYKYVHVIQIINNKSIQIVNLFQSTE